MGFRDFVKARNHEAAQKTPKLRLPAKDPSFRDDKWELRAKAWGSHYEIPRGLGFRVQGSGFRL